MVLYSPFEFSAGIDNKRDRESSLSLQKRYFEFHLLSAGGRVQENTALLRPKIIPSVL